MTRNAYLCIHLAKTTGSQITFRSLKWWGNLFILFYKLILYQLIKVDTNQELTLIINPILLLEEPS